MKKIVLIFVSLLFFIFVSLAQEILENPKKPLNRNAGRAFQLKEIMRIREDGKEVIFTGPYDLQVGDDGGIYFFDNFQLYKFNERGKFIFKIVRRGQGPGEASMRTSYMVIKDEIVIQAKAPPKIMRFTLQGSLKTEIQIQTTHLFNFLGYTKDKFYGFYEEIPHEAMKKEGFVNFPISLWEITYDFQKLKKRYSFPVKYYVIRGVWWPRARFNYILKDEKTFFAVHTADYKIVKFNIERNRIEKVFKRKYRRIKVPSHRRKREHSGVFSAPPLKYYQDIQKLLIYKDQLWVVSSTLDEQRNPLIDVYNMKGIYIDNFYLRFPEDIIPRNFAYGTIVIKGSYIYTIDEDSKGYFSIGKYQIMDF